MQILIDVSETEYGQAIAREVRARREEGLPDEAIETILLGFSGEPEPVNPPAGSPTSYAGCAERVLKEAPLEIPGYDNATLDVNSLILSVLR